MIPTTKYFHFLWFIIIFLFSFHLPYQLSASEKKVNIYLFWGEGCPHCAKAKTFLQKMEQKYPEVQIHQYEVSHTEENQPLLEEVEKVLNTQVKGIPFIVIGEKYFTGWYSDKLTGTNVENAIREAISGNYNDLVSKSLSGKDYIRDSIKVPKQKPSPNEVPGMDEIQKPLPPTIDVPIFGEIETHKVSLPLLTIILGVLDGFNPCAMWALLFLISLLLGMKDRIRMWILGSAFIVASAAVYFIFMAAWLNLILFLGFIFWIRIVIGIIALGGGIYNLREYFVNKDSTCKVTEPEKRKAVFERLKSITQMKNFWLALGGIILLAFAVNLVELICSAGLPAVYTQVLALSDLTKTEYYLYILLYIFFFMVDDLFVFFIAMSTLHITGVTTKYTRISHLIGGILMLIIGLLLIFKHEWLMFG